MVVHVLLRNYILLFSFNPIVAGMANLSTRAKVEGGATKDGFSLPDPPVLIAYPTLRDRKTVRAKFFSSASSSAISVGEGNNEREGIDALVKLCEDRAKGRSLLHLQSSGIEEPSPLNMHIVERWYGRLLQASSSSSPLSSCLSGSSISASSPSTPSSLTPASLSPSPLSSSTHPLNPVEIPHQVANLNQASLQIVLQTCMNKEGEGDRTDENSVDSVATPAGPSSSTSLFPALSPSSSSPHLEAVMGAAERQRNQESLRQQHEQKMIQTTQLEQSMYIMPQGYNDHTRVDGVQLMQENKPKKKITMSDTTLLPTVTRIEETDIILGDKIGSGSFSTVYKGSYQGRQVALKRIQIGGDSSMPVLLKEANILSHLSHPSLLTLYGVILTPREFSFITSYACYGTLEDVLFGKQPNDGSPSSSSSSSSLADQPIPLNTSQRFHIAKQIRNALIWLHHKCDPPIVHRDIKPRNVLLGPSLLDVQLSDFGFATCFQAPAPSSSSSSSSSSLSNESIMVGSPFYMAPEILLCQKKDISEKVDVYAFGITLWELITGKQAYKSEFGSMAEIVQTVGTPYPLLSL